MRTLILLACSAAFASAAPVPKELKKDELARFEGVWWEMRCNDTDSSDLNGSRQFSFNRDGSAGIHSKAGAAPSQYKFALDSTTTPRSFTWVPTRGGIEYNAIYKFDGDRLAIVFTNSNKPRPIEVRPGAGDVYYELVRVK